MYFFHLGITRAFPTKTHQLERLLGGGQEDLPSHLVSYRTMLNRLTLLLAAQFAAESEAWRVPAPSSGMINRREAFSQASTLLALTLASQAPAARACMPASNPRHVRVPMLRACEEQRTTMLRVAGALSDLTMDDLEVGGPSVAAAVGDLSVSDDGFTKIGVVSLDANGKKAKKDTPANRLKELQAIKNPTEKEKKELRKLKADEMCEMLGRGC